MATARPRIYIDSCYYIDVARGRHAAALDPDRASHLHFIESLLMASIAGDIEIWASTLVIPECLHVDSQAQAIPEEVQKTFVDLLTSGTAVKLAAADFFIAERARDLRWVHDIRCGRSADMVHVATALEMGCVEFITTNKKSGPLQGDAPAKLAKLGLRAIEAPQTSVLPAQYLTANLFTQH